jgi:hypothetical protein
MRKSNKILKNHKNKGGWCSLLVMMFGWCFGDPVAFPNMEGVAMLNEKMRGKS